MENHMRMEQNVTSSSVSTQVEVPRTNATMLISTIMVEHDGEWSTPQRKSPPICDSMLFSRENIKDKRKRLHMAPTSPKSVTRRFRRNLSSLVWARSMGDKQYGEIDGLLSRYAEISSSRSPEAKTRMINLPPEAKCTIALAVPQDDDDIVVSTHGGDHTVKVSCLSNLNVLKTLTAHTRTPWTVAIHPLDSSIIATGCLSGKVCIWKNYDLFSQIEVGEDIVMSLAFRVHEGNRRDLDEIFVACGDAVLSWRLMDEGPILNKVIERSLRVQSICFTNPLLDRGSMITAESQAYGGNVFSLSHVALWSQTEDKKLNPESLLQDAVLYSEGGLSVSKCGRFLCAVRVIGELVREAHLELVVISLQQGSLGARLRSVKLEGDRAFGVTSVKFSPTDEHIVCGYGVSRRPLLKGTDKKHCLSVFTNYVEHGEEIKLVADVHSAVDDVNVAIFHPQSGVGILYGTRQGPLRLWGV